MTHTKKSPVQRRLALGALGSVACLGLAGSLLARDAEAVTANVIAGSACHNTPGSATCGVSNALVFNPHPSSCTVHCPIIRRNLMNTNGLAGLFVTGVSLSCTAEARTFNNGAWDSEFKSGNGILSFPGVNTSPVNGTYSLKCVLGPGGELQSVRWDEF